MIHGERIDRREIEILIGQALDEPLKMVEDGGAMKTQDAKQTLRLAVKHEAVVAIIEKIKSFIKWDTRDNNSE